MHSSNKAPEGADVDLAAVALALTIALGVAARVRHTHEAGGPACFYCDGSLGADMHRSRIYPRDTTLPLHTILPPPWHHLNRVLACPRCVEAKGVMSPRQWLAAMPEAGRERLRQRLADLAAYHEPIANAGHALAA